MPEPPAVPSMSSEESKEDREYRRRMDAARQGKASTVLTSNVADEGLGTAKKTLGGE